MFLLFFMLKIYVYVTNVILIKFYLQQIYIIHFNYAMCDNKMISVSIYKH